ncbi:uncharacterized protein LOC125646050 [Ostrea edulis]|uniref:uncharacterized protein LOC125646050 n=1 Tax=Ostrea edulis TaxID=37623 RepID=UPI0024AECE2C|nr:uncharacterized protein LOC125646050 [Ostrea edulis]
MSRKLAPRTMRLDSHFIVRYLCDDDMQVRSRAYFKCDADSVISDGETYSVQWGRPKEVNEAIVLHSGTEQEMQLKLNELMRQLPRPVTPPALSSPSSSTSPQSPSPPQSPRLETPPPKRRKISQALTKSGKPKATVIAVGASPLTSQPDVELELPPTSEVQTIPTVHGE